MELVISHHLDALDDHYDCSDFQHAVGSDANCCSTESKASGSGAATSSEFYHSQLNSKNLTSFIERDSLILHASDVLSPTQNNDYKSQKSMVEILTSIEIMFKPSLSDLANSHGVELGDEMSIDDIRNVLSDLLQILLLHSHD